MTLRAIVRDGGIRLIDPLPIEVADGQEATVDLSDPVGPLSAEEIAEWLGECDRLAASIDPKDVDLVQQSIAEDRAAARAMTRREWNLP